MIESIPDKPYEMGYGAEVKAQRYHNLRAGLLSTWDIVILYQDMIEAGCVPQALLPYAAQLVAQGLCRVPDQMTYH